MAATITASDILRGDGRRFGAAAAAEADDRHRRDGGLVPILWSTGVGSDVMKPIAAPIVGGMVTSTIHVLIITPVIFYIMKVRALRRGRQADAVWDGGARLTA